MVNQLKFNFSNTPLYSSFYYKLAQKGLIDMNEALKRASKIVMKSNISNRNIVNTLLWFLPELFEEHKNDNVFLDLKIDVKSATFFRKFFPSNVDGYKKMRDSGIPIDDVSRAIYIDDVDTLQSIISKSGIDINKAKISPSLFDVFEIFYANDSYSFINYSVMCGSVKCFKYLLLNHAEIDDLTFILSLYGGNTEIIRAVDQADPMMPQNNTYRNPMNDNYPNYFSFSDSKNNKYYRYDRNYLNCIVAPVIMNHRNDLFDWIFETKLNIIQTLSIVDIAFFAVQNGNAHVLTQCIDKGLDLNSNIISMFLNEAFYNGFYRISQLLVSFVKENIPMNHILMENVFNSGNILIYNLLNENVVSFNSMYGNNANLNTLVNMIMRNHNKLAMHVIESGYFTLTNSNSFRSIFSAVIKNKNIVLFNFLRDKYTLDKIVNLYFSMFSDSFNMFFLLKKSCQYGFFEAVKELTEFILSKNPSADFTSSFYCAVCSGQKEIYQYLLDKNVEIRLKRNDPELFAITMIDDNDLCVKLLSKIKLDMKDIVLNEIFNLAILHGNKNLVEILLDEKRLTPLSLIKAVRSSNIDIVNMVLSLKIDHYFINCVTNNGTALNIAVQNNNIEIVKRLLSIPGINTTYYDNENSTPLMTAITNFNIEMIDLFVEFYGDQIQSQIWQINNSILKILSVLSKANENTNKRQELYRNVYVDDDDNDDDDDDCDDEKDIAKISLFDTKDIFSVNKEKIFQTISKLTQFENVDLNCHFSSYTFLLYACEINEFDLFNSLIKSNKVDVNTYSPLTGNSPLMVAIENNNFSIAQFLIEHNDTDINHRNYNGHTALLFAVSKENESLVQSIISNTKFNPIIGGLYTAYFRSTKKITELLLNVKELDVNVGIEVPKFIELFKDGCNINNNSNAFRLSSSDLGIILNIPFICPLIKAVLELESEMIDTIVSHPTFDKDKSRYVDAIFASVYMHDINMFKKLLSLFGNDVNLIGNNGESLLCYSIYIRAYEITTDILNNDTFDSGKSQIVSALLKAGIFTSLPINDIGGSSLFASNLFGTPRSGLPNIILMNVGPPPVPAALQQQQAPALPGGFGQFNQFPSINSALIDQMDELCDFDELHEKLIKFNEPLLSGKTFFTSINSCCQNIPNVINFLIARGADPNLPDKNGVYPLEYSIQLNNMAFIQSMIELQDIDLSIISTGNCISSLKGDTILHMLIKSNILNIFTDVLRMLNLDIINKENINGDTPLLAACKFHRLSFIMSLFAIDDLDYKHRNKEGKDALDILENSVNPFNKSKFHNIWRGRFNNQNVQLEPKDIQDKEKREYYEKLIEFF